MKNRIEEKVRAKSHKITIELGVEEFAQVKQMADYLGATVKQVVEALVVDQPEDYLGRKNDDIWEYLADYISDCYGETERLTLVKRYLAAFEANSKFPSAAERLPLFDSALRDADAYEAHLLGLGKNGAPINHDRIAA